MLLLIQKGLVFMLAVNIDKKLRQFFYLPGSYRLSVYLVYTFAHLHLPAYDDTSVFLRFQFQLEQLSAHSVIPAAKDQFHQSTVLPLAKHIPLEFAAQCQSDAPYQQGLSRTGLPGENIQSFPEFHLCLFHQSKIFHM